MTKINSNIFTAWVILIVIAVTTSIAGLYIGYQIKNPNPTTIPTILPSEFPDFEAFNLLASHSLVLVNDQESYVPKDKPIVGRVDKNLIIGGKLTRGYIYIEVSVDYGKPLSQWDSIYSTMNGVGGHLLRSASLKVPGDHITRLLYGLDQIPVISLPYSDSKKPVMVDWFKYFFNKDSIRFDTFLSSLRQGGKINKIEIRYECEVNTTCEIVLK